MKKVIIYTLRLISMLAVFLGCSVDDYTNFLCYIIYMCIMGVVAVSCWQTANFIEKNKF